MGYITPTEFQTFEQIDNQFKSIENVKEGLSHVLYNAQGELVTLNSGTSKIHGRWYQFETYIYNAYNPNIRLVKFIRYYESGYIEKFQSVETIIAN